MAYDYAKDLHAADFLALLFGGVGDGFVEVTYIAPDGVRLFPNVVVQWAELPLGDIDPDLPNIRQMNRAGYGAYVAPAVRAVKHPAEERISKRGTPYTFYPRGKASDARWITALWVDVDSDEPDALAKVGATMPTPSIQINSGGGWHCYWLLTEPLRVTVENHERVKWTLKGMAMSTGADTAVADLARVMRLPGTVNTKPSRGGAVCHVTQWLPVRYQYHQFEVNYAPLAMPKEPRVMRHIPVEASGGLPAWVNDYLTNGAAEGGRNRRLFAAAVEYNANGLSQMQAENDLGARASADGLDQDEITRTIASAYRFKASPNITPTSKLKMATGDHIAQLRQNRSA